MRFLLFQIYAPLVSWGDIAVGGERLTNRHASKSAIIGLVAAALGIRREEDERLDLLAENIGVAVKLFSGGSVLKDYHTTQVPRSERQTIHYTRKAELSADNDKIGTILSSREYRCDSLSVVAIYLKNEHEGVALDQIEQALRMPQFHLYFGRKSCVPSLPLSPVLVDEPDLKVAFNKYDISFPLPITESKPEWLKKAFADYPEKMLFEKKISYFWEEGVESGLDFLQIVERYDQPLSRKRWQFEARKEYMAVVKEKEATDVF